MFQIFTDLAAWFVFDILGLSPETKLGDALHFLLKMLAKSLFCSLL